MILLELGMRFSGDVPHVAKVPKGFFTPGLQVHQSMPKGLTKKPAKPQQRMS